MQEFQTVLALKASGQVASAGTVNGGAVGLRRKFSSMSCVLDVTEVGDGAELADTLDVYVDSSIDGGTTWINVGRFARIEGVDGVKASGVLTLTGAIVPGSHAESVLTSDATEVADGDTVTIGSTVYRFKDTPAQAYDVKRNGTAAITLDNLKAAINASGTPGVEYFAGTLAHPTVVATTNTDTTQKIVARVPGTAANSAATTETSSHLSWADTTLGGGTGTSNPGVAPETVVIGAVTYSVVDVLSETNGAAAIANQVLFGADSAAALDNLKSAINGTAGAGTTYSTGTVAHSQVTATTNTNTEQTVEAVANGSSYNSVATTDTIGNGGWADETLTGGTLGPGVAEKQVLAFDASVVESTQPVDVTADINSTSGGKRHVGFGDALRYRSVVAGSAPDFTFSVKAFLKE